MSDKEICEKKICPKCEGQLKLAPLEGFIGTDKKIRGHRTYRCENYPRCKYEIKCYE